MVLDENNYQQRINAYTRQDWQPLLELIPELENTTSFGEWAGGQKDKEGVIQMPYNIHAPIVSRFLEIVYGLPVMISFDWGGWTEGRIIAGNEHFDFDTIDLPTKCKLITAIVRNDRFCEGALVAAFESGLILRILQSIQRQQAGSQ